MTIVSRYFDMNTFLVDIIIDGTYYPAYTRNEIKSPTRKNQSINIRTQKKCKSVNNPESAIDNGNKVTVTFLIMATQFSFLLPP